MTSKRTIDAANETGFLAPNVKPVFFARLDFSGGVLRVHTEIGPKTATHPVHGSELYTGLGDFGGIQGDVVESVSGSPQRLLLTLSGVNATLINDLLTDDYYRRDAEIMIGIEDSTGTLLADPEILFSGFMDKADIALKSGFGNIGLTLEGRGTNGRTGSDQRFTDEDKQAETPGDLFAEYVYRMQDITLRWGDRSFNSPFSPRVPRGIDGRGGFGSRR